MHTMNTHYHRIKATAVLLFSLLCSFPVSSDQIPIDQIPMYGGMDRNAHPELKRGDEDFIADVSEHYGSREIAAQKWVEQGFTWHQKDNWIKAMQRFNQAWLLDPGNPEVYWGFSALVYDQGKNCEAMRMGEKAIEVGIDSIAPPNFAMFLADFGMITSICSVSGENEEVDSATLIDSAEQSFTQSENIWPSAYLYDKWWQALYWRGEYEAAWQKVAMMRAKGEEPYEGFLQALKEKMPEPKK